MAIKIILEAKEFKGGKILAKELRDFVKQFKNQKFSITSEHNLIRVTITNSSDDLLITYPEYEEYYERYLKPKGIKKQTEKDYNNNYFKYGHQLGHNNNSIKYDYIITKKAKEIFTKINDFLNEYYEDNSDVQSDYFDTNFYRHFEINLKK